VGFFKWAFSKKTHGFLGRFFYNNLDCTGSTGARNIIN